MSDELGPSTPVKKSPINLEEIKAKLLSQPQTQVLIEKMRVFWQESGRKVKLVGSALGILILILVAVRLGGNIARLNRPGEVEPVALPTVMPVVDKAKVSVFSDLKQEIQDFSPLLPDPAPPAVDQNISLKLPER